jgi:proteasome accessory factor C
MSRLTADDRMRRMLSIIPWVAGQDGVPVDEVCERFQIDRKTLLEGFEILSFVGVHPYTPDTQIDAVVEGDLVFVRMPQWFDRPLRLTPEQGLSLVASAQSLLSVPGADPEGPLARGIAKIAASLGADQDTIDVTLGAAAAETMAALQQATEQHRPVEIDYYTYGRDELTTRVVEPHRLYADQGSWYLAAHCRLAEGDRIFRVDRINRATVAEGTFEPPDEPPTMGVFRPSPDDPRVTLRLGPGARWVAEQYPTEARVERDDGTVDVTLAITAPAWLERLLVRLGPSAEVLEAPTELADAGSRAASRILARYVDR